MFIDSLYRAETIVHRYLPRWLLHPRYCFVYRLRAANFRPRDRKAAEESTTLRWATPSDFDALAAQAGEKVVTKRLVQGHRAATLWLQQTQLVGTAWFAVRSYLDDETEVEINLGPQEAWLFGSWIHHQIRGNGYYSRLIQFAFLELQASSITDLMFAVDATNFRSQRVHRALGAERCGSIRGIRVFGHSAFRVNTAG
jgi:RimJ/RimL family protein N-acetyltransferase